LSESLNSSAVHDLIFIHGFPCSVADGLSGGREPVIAETMATNDPFDSLVVVSVAPSWERARLFFQPDTFEFGVLLHVHKLTRLLVSLARGAP
jgi:hypothetical protein